MTVECLYLGQIAHDSTKPVIYLAGATDTPDAFPDGMGGSLACLQTRGYSGILCLPFADPDDTRNGAYGPDEAHLWRHDCQFQATSIAFWFPRHQPLTPEIYMEFGTWAYHYKTYIAIEPGHPETDRLKQYVHRDRFPWFGDTLESVLDAAVGLVEGIQSAHQPRP